MNFSNDPSDAEFEAFLRARPGFNQVERALADRFDVDVSEIPISLSGTLYSFMEAEADGYLTQEDVTKAMSSPDEAIKGLIKMLKAKGIDTDELEQQIDDEETASQFDSWVDITEEWRNFMLEGGEPAMAYAVLKVSFNPDSPPGEQQQAGFQIVGWVDESQIPDKLREKMTFCIIAAHQKWRRDNGIED